MADISKTYPHNIIAIIPARGGSKGMPRKNVQMLAGRPLIAYAIEASLQALCVDRVIVSTDDPEIYAIAKRYGAVVVWRPSEISGDMASSESSLLHVLTHLRKVEDYEPEIVVFVQCTSPLTLGQDIDCTVDALLANEADSALAVTPFHYFLWREGNDRCATGINHKKSERLLRQCQTPQFLETGAVYAMRAKGFLTAKHRFFGKTVMYEMPSDRVLEIDEPLDLEIAQIRIRKRYKKNAISLLPRYIEAVVFDFDGVFTDNRVSVSEEGKESVFVNRSDGLGISEFKKIGIPCVVISSEINTVVKARCEKIQIEYFQGVKDKSVVLQTWAEKKAVNLENVVYVGNDQNDIECMQLVGCGVAVKDAHETVKRVSKLILQNNGGHGAVREICDLLIAKIQGVKNA